HLLKDALCESVVLSIIAALTGLLLMWWLLDLFPALVPHVMGGLVIDARLDGRAIIFTAMLSLVTILLVGVVPAFRMTRTDLATCLKETSVGGAAGPRRFGVRDFLIVAQVALSVIVLVAAGLLVRSLVYSLNVNPGFDTHGKVATFYLVPGSGYDNAA